MHILGIQRGIAHAAGGIDVTVFAHVLEQHVIARAPVEAIGLVRALGRTIGIAGLAAGRIIDYAPGMKAVVALVRAHDPEPVDQHADALLKSVSVKAIVAGSGLEPDQAADALGFVQALARAGLAVRRILIDDRDFRLGAVG